MTIQEVSERYQIPMEILKEYESWGMDGAAGKAVGAWQYDDTDLERLGLILSLRDMGFESPEVESYMRLLGQQGTEAQRLRMLNKKRYVLLDNIHAQEKLLEQLDYLRYHIRKQQDAKQKMQTQNKFDKF